MDSMGLGVVISIMGIIVTFLTLYILMLVIKLLSRLFPYKEQSENK